MKLISSGKVRDLYEVDDKRLMIRVSDRISAFDHILPCEIEGKGIVLNQVSAFWFDYLSDIIPNHMITRDSKGFPEEFQTESYSGRSMLVKKLEMIPLECIVRGYLSGSAWAEYKTEGQVNGILLPGGLRENEQLEEPLFTPSKKSLSMGHDEAISYDEMETLLGSDLASQLKEISIKLYEKSAAYTWDKGIILADTKFEFGLDKAGEIVLGDEVLTPDSSRLWSKETYQVGVRQEAYDKQYLRDWLSDHGHLDQMPKSIPKSVIDKTWDKYLVYYKCII